MPGLNLSNFAPALKNKFRKASRKLAIMRLYNQQVNFGKMKKKSKQGPLRATPGPKRTPNFYMPGERRLWT